MDRLLGFRLMRVFVAVAVLAMATLIAHVPGTTERVSVASDGTEANADSGFLSPSAISADGRFIAFDSAATNLLPEGNAGFNIFLHDRLTGTTELVSVDSRGNPANDLSSSPSLSADARFVAFDSDASRLVSGDRNNITDVFVHDRATGETRRVSVTSAGEEGESSSHSPSISADGRFVTFHANSSLAPEDTNTTTDVYLHDLQTSTTELISIGLGGAAGDGTSFIQDISADGRFVSFVSSSRNLTPGEPNDIEANVYVRDRQTATTELVSVGTDGTLAFVGFFDRPSISADGRFVAFATFTSLDPADTSPNSLDIYLRDRATGTTELISVNNDEIAADGRSESPSVSGDGRYVAFQSDSTNLVPEAPGGFFPDEDIFVRDRLSGTTVRVSENNAGVEGNARSLSPGISDDGLVVAFGSDASNLVPNDTNLAKDVFVHDDSPDADVAVTIADSPDPVIKGGNVSYTVTVTNAGPGTAAGVLLTNELPANTRFVSATPGAGSCEAGETVVTCQLGDVPAGATVTVTIVVTARRDGTITFTATARSVSPDANLANNTDSESTTVLR